MPIGAVRYRVSMPEPISHELHVTMQIPPLPGRAAFDLVFPAWAPGSYMVRDFARNIYDLVITDGRGRPLENVRIDKQRWRVRAHGRAVRVSYRVFAFEATVRTSFLDDSHAYWNGTSLFFYVEGEVARPCMVQVDPPRGWAIATALPGRGRTFRAASYDELADSPFEVGTHRQLAFRSGGTRFEVALYGPTNADIPRLVRDLRAVVGAAGRMFGGFPFRKYLFIIHCLPARGGGLEHASSTTLDIAGMGFEDDKAYRTFAALAAHEFFHAWNVKRIHDRILGPFDYTRENYTRLLWFHEGFTEFAEELILLRSGLMDAGAYLDELADGWGKYLARPGRNVTPLAELSFEAWIKQYKPADNHINRAISYYEKGKWAALVLELMLREATGGRRGVIDLFRRLWQRFGRKERGIVVDDIQAATTALAGRSMDGYFRRFIDGTTELPVPRLLRRAGITVGTRAPGADDDDETRGERQRAWAGLAFAADRSVVKNVVPGSPAWKAGLTFGDELVAIDNYRVAANNVGRRMADHRPGTAVRVAFFRQETLRTTILELAETPDKRWHFRSDSHAQGPARAIRRGWLGV